MQTFRKLGVAFLTLFALAGALLVASPAANAAGPVVSASQASGLRDGQKITVSGTGFAPNASLSLIECSGLTGQPACDLGTYHPVTTGADGSWSVTDFAVKGGEVGDGSCPGQTAGAKCYLIATTNPADPAATGVLPIGFAPVVTLTPSTDVANGAKLAVHGYGYPAATMINIVECSNPSNPSGTGCDLSNIVSATTDANGVFDATITVKSGVVGFDGSTCNPGAVCTIGAAIQGGASGAATFTFAAAAPAVATTTTATFTKATSKIVGTVTAGVKGIKGLHVKLQQRVGKAWKTVATLTTSKGGAYTSKPVNDAGSYRASTPKQGSYKASVSAVVKVA